MVTDTSEADHLSHLEEVLGRLQEEGIGLRRDKCHFFQPLVTYLGHHIDAKGIHMSTEKVKVIKDAPVPQNVNELRSFLGLVNYYGKFVPNLASLLYLLHQVLHSGVQ